MTTLSLGDFVFARGELPESIVFGAAQQLHVHMLVGGARVVDAMGAVPQRQEWSGWLSGPLALARARLLKRLAEAGLPLPLQYGEFAYTAVIASFSAEFRAGPHLPYAIALEVIDDHGAVGSGTPHTGLAQAVAQDLIAAAAQAGAIGDGGLIAAVAAVADAVTAGAAAQMPIAIAQAQADRLDEVAAARISGVAVLSLPATGGNPVDPGTLSRFGAGLVAAAGAAQQSYRLKATTQLLGRTASNLAAASGTGSVGGATVTTGSTDLYHLAAAAYGDARDWTRIAQANQLTDPVVTGITRLVIPAVSGPATGG